MDYPEEEMEILRDKTEYKMSEFLERLVGYKPKFPQDSMGQEEAE